MASVKPKDNIFWTLKDMKIPFVQEHRFDDKRQFRFDYAIVDRKIAIEYEGIYNVKEGSGKSRHTTVTGYSRDVEKYNLAVVKGWKVLRYTSKNYQNLRNDLTQLL